MAQATPRARRVHFVRFGAMVVLAAFLGQRAPMQSAPMQSALMAAQPAGGKDAKTDKSKEARPLEPGKAPAKDKVNGPALPEKPAAPDKQPAPENPAPPRLPLDKLKLPPGAVLVIIDSLKDAGLQFPQMWLLSPEQYQALHDRIRLLEQQLKPERAAVHSCKLTGKLDGDYLALRAEYTFATEQPRTSVALGLQGAHLVDGELDGGVPSLDYGDDGFVMRVDKAGAHRAALNVKAPLTQRRAGLLSASAERGLELKLPGAPAGALTLDLPAAIKEIRVNDAMHKSKAPGHWELPLGLVKQLHVSWKEPASLLGAGPPPSMDATVAVRLEETFAQIQAELVLDDPRGQTKEWRLLLPAGAAPVVKAPAAVAHQWIAPDGKNPFHILRLKEAAGERISVTVSASVSRPVARLPVGPFALAGLRTQGTILVQAAPRALAGQRLAYHRHGEVVQRDLPKTSGSLAALASFQFAAAPGAAKAPVDLEFRASPSLVETHAEHALRLVGGGDTWQIETTTRLTAKALADVADYLEVQFPQPRLEGLLQLGVTAGAGFPAALSWGGLTPAPGAAAWAWPGQFRWEEDAGEVAAADRGRNVRIKWRRGDAKQFLATIHGRYAVPTAAERVRLELPRALGLQRGGRVTITAGEHVEFLLGPPGREEPAPQRHQYQLAHELLPTTLELAWRVGQREFPVAAVADVTLQGRSAQVKQTLSFSLPAPAPGAAVAPVRLRVPPGIAQLVLTAGGKAVSGGVKEGAIWLTPSADAAGKCELRLEYDVLLTPAEADDAGHWLKTRLVWPQEATQHDAKVRVWCPPGMFAELAATPAWRERGVEIVPGRESVPALLVHGVDPQAELVLRLRDPGASKVAALVAERALMQVEVDDDGSQRCRLRLLVRKLAARTLTVELPVRVAENLQAVRLGPERQQKLLAWHSPGGALVEIAIPAELSGGGPGLILELEYKVPVRERRLWQSVMQPPRFQAEVLMGNVRWQVRLAGDRVAVVLAPGAHLDYHWELQGWLLAPESSVDAGDLEAWLLGREAAEGGAPELSFWRNGSAPVRILHVPRPVWLLACSGSLLFLGLALYLLPLSRWWLGLLLAALSLGVAVAALWWPALLPPVAFGVQPGLAVLTLLLAAQWLLQERYRRRVVFLPGFTRLQAQPSRVRPAAKKREPSTVDAPEAPADAGAN